MIRAPRSSETDHLVAVGESTGIFGPGEADALLRGTLDVFHEGRLGLHHEVRVWASTADDIPAGWVYFAPHDAVERAWQLWWIGVEPAHHGQGIGDDLLRFVERHVVHAGGRALTIETSSLPLLARARRFYADRGYTLRDVTADAYGPGDDKLTFVKTLMSRGPTADAVFVRADRRHSPELGALVEVSRTYDGTAVDHVSLGVNDLEAAKRFYDAALAPLGFSPRTDGHEVGYFLTKDVPHHDDFAFYIGFEDPAAKRRVVPSAGFHIAFRAPTREAVVRFYEAALQAGGRDDGPPGLRPRYHADCFGAFVLDPDGHRIEAVCHLRHEPTNGGERSAR